MVVTTVVVIAIMHGSGLLHDFVNREEVMVGERW
jgi:hypothetical protein